jgi:hypothetical protein
MSANPKLSQTTTDDLAAVLGSEPRLSACSLRSSSTPLSGGPTNESDAVSALLSEYRAGWLCTGSGVYTCTDGRFTHVGGDAQPNLNEVLSAELVNADGSRSLHLRRHGDALVAHRMEEGPGGRPALAARHQLRSSAPTTSVLHYTVYWTEVAETHDGTTLHTWRQTHARLCGLE